MRENDYKKDIEAISSAYLSYIGYSMAYSLDQEILDSHEKAFEFLLKLFGNNRRMLLEALRNCLHHYFRIIPEWEFTELIDKSIEFQTMNELDSERDLDKRIMFYPKKEAGSFTHSKFYLTTEALMIGGLGYRPDPLIYGFKRVGEGFVPDENEIIYKYPEIPKFLYNLFSYPYQKVEPMRIHIFAGIRILQLLKNAKNNSMHIDDIVEYLCTYFGYSDSILRFIIDEMKDHGLIQPPWEIPLIEGIFKITFRGKHILDRYSSSLEYIALALEATALPKKVVVVGGGDNKNKLMPISPYYKELIDIADSSVINEQYVINNKIKSSVRFVVILREIEKKEEKLFNELKKKHNESDSFTDNGFPIVQKIIDSVLLATHKIVDAAYVQEDQEIISMLENYLEEDL